MSRSLWKGPFIHSKFLKKKFLVAKNMKIWARNSIVLSHFVGFSFLIHVGNTFRKFVVTREKIGYKFGEFCTTHCKYKHKDKLKHQKLKNKGLKKKK